MKSTIKDFVAGDKVYVANYRYAAPADIVSGISCSSSFSLMYYSVYFKNVLTYVINVSSKKSDCFKEDTILWHAIANTWPRGVWLVLEKACKFNVSFSFSFFLFLFFFLVFSFLSLLSAPIVAIFFYENRERLVEKNGEGRRIRRKIDDERSQRPARPSHARRRVAPESDPKYGPKFFVQSSRKIRKAGPIHVKILVLIYFWKFVFVYIFVTTLYIKFIYFYVELQKKKEKKNEIIIKILVNRWGRFESIR